VNRAFEIRDLLTLGISFTQTMLFTAAALSFISLAGLANAHGFVTGIKGANGKTENGFGVNTSSIKPNDEGPVSVFRTASQPCGVGVQAGPIDIASSIEAAISAGLPTVDSTGSISMNWQQVTNGNDGGGPGTAEIDTTGTGQNFKPLTITKNFAYDSSQLAFNGSDNFTGTEVRIAQIL
jgi:hypothetical protein